MAEAVRLCLDLFRLLVATPAALTQLQRHDQHLGELLLRVNQHAPLKAELRAAAAEVHAAFTGDEIGLLELPPTDRPLALLGGEAADAEEGAHLPAVATALIRRLSAASS